MLSPYKKIEGAEVNLELLGLTKTLLYRACLQWTSVPQECLFAGVFLYAEKIVC